MVFAWKTKYFQKKIETLEADNSQFHEMYENELNEAYQRIDILQGEVDRLRKLKSEISRLNIDKGNTIAEEPTNELTPDDIVGTYEYITEDSKTNRAIFMNNGAGQHHDLEGQKISFKWKTINEEVQITGNFKQMKGKLPDLETMYNLKYLIKYLLKSN